MGDRPNILIIMNDQHHAGCFGYAGHPDVKTPNVDALAADGVVFRNAFCQNGLCVPSRASLLTGQYPSTHGVYGGDNMGIPGDLLSMATYLRNFDYQTAMIGKKHMPEKFIPSERFEEMVEEIDLFPTLCDLLDVPTPKAVQGKSLRRILEGGDAPERDTVFFEYTMCKTVHTRTHKLSYGFDGKREIGELYDLTSDLHEYVNLFESSEHRDIRESLIRKLLDWQFSIQQPPNWARGHERYPGTRWFSE